MDNSIRFFLLFVVICLACEPSPEIVPDYGLGLSEAENALIGTWQYEYIIANENKFEYADNTMELSLSPGGDLGGNRAFLFRRRVSYLPNGTYQLRWIERGDYQLGTEGDPNWQPSYGYWSVSGDQLIHNQGTSSETHYTINLQDDGSFLTRRSARHMSKSHYPYFQWKAGEKVVQTEYFTRVLKD